MRQSIVVTERILAVGIEFEIHNVPATLRDDGTHTIHMLVVERMTLAVAGELVRLGIVSGESFRFMRKALNHKAAALAELFGVMVETISRWEIGQRPVSRMAWAVLAEKVAMRVHAPRTAFDLLEAALVPPPHGKRVEIELQAA